MGSAEKTTPPTWAEEWGPATSTCAVSGRTVCRNTGQGRASGRVGPRVHGRSTETRMTPENTPAIEVQVRRRGNDAPGVQTSRYPFLRPSETKTTSTPDSPRSTRRGSHNPVEGEGGLVPCGALIIHESHLEPHHNRSRRESTGTS